MSITLRRLTLCALIISLACAACGEDDPAPKNNNDTPGWLFNNQSNNQNNDDPMDMARDIASDSSPGVDMKGEDQGVDFGLPPEDMSVIVEDMGVEDSGPDINTSMNDCATNNDCARSEVCCAGFDGKQSCTPRDQCRFGGVCGTDAECSGANETCCDLSSIGVNNKVCTDQCQNTMGCQNNNECAQGEVCCPSFQGAPACQPADQCNSGGLCGDKMDCLNGEECCGFGRFKVCLNQCSF